MTTSVTIGPSVAGYLVGPLKKAVMACRKEGLYLPPAVIDAVREMAEIAALDALNVPQGIPLAGTSPPTDDAGWMTTAQVGVLLDSTPRAVVGRINRGTLPAVRVGRAWRIDPVAVLAAAKQKGITT